MPAALNIFEHNVETALLGILEANVTGIAAPVKFARGEDASIKTLPMVVVSSVDLEEIIYQSGNYRVTVEIITTDDLDSGSPQESALLFAKVLDALQMVNLKELMNDTGLVVIQGIVLGAQKVNDLGDRQWQKTVSIEFFGFAIS